MRKLKVASVLLALTMTAVAQGDQWVRITESESGTIIYGRKIERQSGPTVMGWAMIEKPDKTSSVSLREYDCATGRLRWHSSTSYDASGDSTDSLDIANDPDLRRYFKWKYPVPDTLEAAELRFFCAAKTKKPPVAVAIPSLPPPPVFRDWVSLGKGRTGNLLFGKKLASQTGKTRMAWQRIESKDGDADDYVYLKEYNCLTGMERIHTLLVYTNGEYSQTIDVAHDAAVKDNFRWEYPPPGSLNGRMFQYVCGRIEVDEI
jgi:hypothetical protein